MGLGIILTAASLWVLNLVSKKVKRPNGRLVLGLTYTIGGK